MDKWVLGVAALAVVVPVLIGVAKGHIPKELLRSWALPLAATTFLLAIGVQFIENSFNVKTKLIVSILFSTVWVVAGLYIGFIQTKKNPHLPEQIQEAMKTVGIIFIGFGLIWSLLSFY